jgi:glycosyltransferase involved in cell wall biosynthesis
MKTVFFIPVFNQILEFPTVLRELREVSLPCDTILLINNGSSDGSEKLVRESGYEYIDLPQNRGVGHAFMVAVDWALERGYDVLGGLASNAKMLPSEMHRLVEPIANGSADYVTGSRFLRGGDSPNLPSFRRSSIPLVNIFVKILTGHTLTDATCGYRAYKLDIFRRAKFNWHAQWLDTYGFEYYLYAKVLLDGTIRWTEVPVTMRYPGKGKRYSKIKPFKGWWEMLKPWLIARIDAKGFAPPDDPSISCLASHG